MSTKSLNCRPSNSGQTDQRKFLDSLVNPEISIPKWTTDIHGIEDAMVKDSPTIKNLLIPFLDFVGKLPLVGHNIKFDFGFIVYNLHLLNIPFPSSQIYCSLKASRTAFEGMPNNRLKTLVEQLSIPLRNHHRGLDDALASMVIFAKAVEKKDSVLKKSFLFNGQDFNKAISFRLPEGMDCLLDKNSYQEVVDVKYRGGSYRDRFRPLKPIGILPLPQGSVLYAQCLFSGKLKNFPIKKIETVKVLTFREQRERLINLEKLNTL